MRGEKGITLIALVITIVVLIILSGVVISSMQQSGIIGRSREAEERYGESKSDEEQKIKEYENAFPNDGDDDSSGKFYFTLSSLGTPKDYKDASAIFDADLFFSKVRGLERETEATAWTLDENGAKAEELYYMPPTGEGNKWDNVVWVKFNDAMIQAGNNGSNNVIDIYSSLVSQYGSEEIYIGTKMAE